MNDLVERLRAALTVNPTPIRLSDIAEAVNEIERLKAVIMDYGMQKGALLGEIERLKAHVEELHEKVAHADCACSFDFSGDVCMVHSPTVQRLEAENAKLKAALNRLTSDIASDSELMDRISLGAYEDACAALEQKETV